jgi:hypothetical protein
MIVIVASWLGATSAGCETRQDLGPGAADGPGGGASDSSGEGGSVGDGGATPAATSGATTSGPGSISATSADTTGSDATSSTSSTTSGGGIQGAYVQVRASEGNGPVDFGTQVEIQARTTPFVTWPEGAGCNTSVDTPGSLDTSDVIDLSGATVTLSAPGLGITTASWSEPTKILAGRFGETMMPEGTVVEVTFGVDSPILTGESVDVVVRRAAVELDGAPPYIVYEPGTDLVVGWESAPMLSLLFAAESLQSPPVPHPGTQRAHCLGDASVSELAIPAELMDIVIANRDANDEAGYGADVTMGLFLRDEQGIEVPTAGNFVTTLAEVIVFRYLVTP